MMHYVITAHCLTHLLLRIARDTRDCQLDGFCEDGLRQNLRKTSRKTTIVRFLLHEVFSNEHNASACDP